MLQCHVIVPKPRISPLPPSLPFPSPVRFCLSETLFTSWCLRVGGLPPWRINATALPYLTS